MVIGTSYGHQYSSEGKCNQGITSYVSAHDPGWGWMSRLRTPLKCYFIYSDLCRYFTSHLSEKKIIFGHLAPFMEGFHLTATET